MASEISVGDIIVVASAAVVGGAAVAGGLRLAWQRWRSTFGLRRATKQKIDRLAIGMYRGYLIDLLGQPALSSQTADGERYVLRFRFQHAWVSTLVGPDEAVAAFSVTVTRRRFRYNLNSLSWGAMSKATLGRTPLSSVVQSLSEGAEWAIGARRVWYREMHSFGNPGMYLHYVLAVNDAGTGGATALPPSSNGQMGVFANEPTVPPLTADLQSYRAQVSPNTITVIGQIGCESMADIARIVEADYDYVRMFDRPKTSAFRQRVRQLRWRLRHRRRST
jgi:hypothetical protein